MAGIISRHRILLVDDDQRILHFSRLKLMASGYEVVTAMTGQGALMMIESQKLDIIVLDLKMPGMGGLEVLRVLRRFSRIPVIVVSGAEELAEQALGLGANAYMAKPFNPDELINKVSIILDKELTLLSSTTPI